MTAAMLRRMPTDRSATTRLEPPYETNGSGIPVSGASPRTAARLTAAWPQMSAVMPAASRFRRDPCSAMATGDPRRRSGEAGSTSNGADEPELLADHREDHVGVRLGKVVDLRTPWPSPRPKTPPEPRLMSACTFWRPSFDGSFHGSRKTSSRARRYGRHPRRDRGEHRRRCRSGRERRQRRAGDEEHRADHHDDRDHGAEIGLGEDEQAEEADEEADRAREILERPRRRLARELRGAPDHERELRELRRLERGGPEADPPSRAVDPLADDEHGEEEASATIIGPARQAQLAEIGT